MSGLGFIFSERELLDEMDKSGFKPFNPIEKEKGYPIPISFLKMTKETGGSDDKEEFVFNGKIHLLLKVNFKLFTLSSEQCSHFFRGIDFIFGKDKILTNEETLLNSINGVVNTIAKINIFCGNPQDWKNASKLVEKYIVWFSEKYGLDFGVENFDVLKRITILPAFAIEYDFSNTVKFDSGIYNNIGIAIFGDKSYYNIRNNQEIIYKDCNMIISPIMSSNSFLGLEENNPDVKTITDTINKYNEFNVKEYIKPVICTNDGMNKVKSSGRIIVPIFKNIRLVLFGTMKANVLKNNEYGIPITFKTINIEINTVDKDKKNRNSLGGVEINISKNCSITVKGLQYFIKAVNKNVNNNWINKIYFANEKCVAGRKLIYGMDLIDKLLCFETPIDSILEMEEYSNVKKRIEKSNGIEQNGEKKKRRRRKTEKKEEEIKDIPIQDDDVAESNEEESDDVNSNSNEETTESEGVIEDIKEL